MFKDGNSLKKRITAATVAVVMAVVTVGTAIYMDGNKAYASRVSLKRIDEIVDEHSSTSEDGLKPFIIYEVVPSYADASLGYLVGGEEPIEDGRSIKEMPSKTERQKVGGFDITVHTYASELVSTEDNDKAVLYDAEYTEDDVEDGRTIGIRGRFEPTGTEDAHDEGVYEYYRENTGGSAGGYHVLEKSDEDGLYHDIFEQGDSYSFEELRGEFSSRHIQLYRDYVSFTRNEDNSGDCDVSQLRLFGEDEYLPYAVDNAYCNERFSLRHIESYTDLSTGDLLFNVGDQFAGVFGHCEFTDADGNEIAEDTDVDEDPTLYTITIKKAGEGDTDVIISANYNDFLYGEEYGYQIGALSDSGEYVISAIDDSGNTFDKNKKKDVVYSDDYSYDDNNCPEDKGPYYFQDENIDSDEYEYAPDDGLLRFDADYTQSVYKSFSYKGGFRNNEWFKNWVFDRTDDSEYEKLCIDVIPVTLAELNELGESLDSAGLIYFAGGDYDGDLTSETAVKITNKLLQDNFPIMMEYSTYYKNQDTQYLANMCLTLMKSGNLPKKVEDLENAPTWELFYGNKTAEENDISFVHGTLFVNDDIDGDGNIDPQSRIASSKFNKKYSDSKANSNNFKEVKDEIEGEKPFLQLNGVWDQFNSEISIATSIRYILNAKNSRVAGKEELKILYIEPLETAQYASADTLENADIDSDNEMNLLKRSIYTSGTWRLAYNYWYTGIERNYTPSTTGVNSLTTDYLKEKWVEKYIIGTIEDGKKPSIDINQMGTRELVGVNTDLNSTYDMIYIGMDTTLLNTRISNNNKTDQTRYTDTSLNGLVYMHVGDTYTNYKDKSNRTGTRYASGNDITLDKYRELRDYIESGYAVLLSDGFFNNDNSINTSKLDSSSNMYKLIKDVVLAKEDGNYKYFGKNVQKKSDFTNSATSTSTRETFARYINIAKLDIKLTSWPQKYNENGTRNYLPDNGDGSYSMIYGVELTNNSAVNATETTYDCKLYIDMDSDGKFEKGESLGGLTIVNGDDQAESEDEDGHFNLKSGHKYTISRNVPEDYVGFIPWKLEFSQNGEDGVRSAVTGFCAVKPEGRREPIHVLQIVPSAYDNEDQHNNTPRKGQNLDLRNGGPLQQYYDQIEEFEVLVDTIDVSNYICKYNGFEGHGTTSMSYYEFLRQYDMVVLGFTDAYQFVCGNNNNSDTYNMNSYFATFRGGASTWLTRGELYRDAALAIREYALSGKSILFTHDLTTNYGTEGNQRGAFANAYLRDIQGMDRYGELRNSLNNISYTNSNEGGTLDNYESVYDENHGRKGSDISDFDTTALIDESILKNTSDATYGATTRIPTSPRMQYGEAEYNYVTAINEGQITQYPFLITEGTGGDIEAGDNGKNSFFEVSPTHSQYFQLNLDTDSTDENVDDDVVVWYTLSGRYDYPNQLGSNLGISQEYSYFHVALHNDARNNYYIYSKGNVFYTGSGHSDVVSEEERKLFVNTLVAAYDASAQDPKLIYKANPWEDGVRKSIGAVYVPYDAQLINSDASVGGFLDKNATINFQPINNNFKNSNKELITEYYVKGDASNYTIRVGNDYYLRVEPVKLSEADGTGALSPVGDIHTLRNRGIYQGEFALSNFHFNLGGASQNVELYIRVGIGELSTDTEFNALPAGECIEAVTICGTQLRELE